MYLNHDFSDEGCNKSVDDPGLGADPPGGDGAPPPLVDSWEDDDPLLTPDNDEDELEDQYSETIIKPKKRPVKGTEETKSKKEHVNVVFIGHVGKFWLKIFQADSLSLNLSRTVNSIKINCPFRCREKYHRGTDYVLDWNGR